MSASKVLKKWDVAYQLLSNVAEASTASAQQVAAVQQKLLTICSPSNDLRVVDKLVKAKMPLKVWQECVKLAQAGTPDRTVLALYAACLVFEALLKRGEANSVKLSSSNSSTVSSLRQQLQQSGLLVQLPALLTGAAQSLEAAAAGAGSITDKPATLVLRVCQASTQVWRDASFTELFAPSIAPSMQLLVQCNKYLTAVLTTTSNSSNGDGSSGGSSSSSSQQQQQRILDTLGPAAAHFSPSLLHVICAMACGAVDGPPQPELLQALDPPLLSNQHFLEVLALQVAQDLLQPLVSRHRARRQREQQQGQRSTDWEWACKLAPKVPQEIAAVLEHLQCSRELVLWQALTRPVTPAEVDSEVWNLVAVFARRQTGPDGRRLAHIVGPQQQPQQLLMLRLLLSVALMQWVPSRPCVAVYYAETLQLVCWLTSQACEDFCSRPLHEGEQDRGEGASARVLPPGILRLLQQQLGVLVPQLVQPAPAVGRDCCRQQWQ